MGSDPVNFGNGKKKGLPDAGPAMPGTGVKERGDKGNELDADDRQAAKSRSKPAGFKNGGRVKAC